MLVALATRVSPRVLEAPRRLDEAAAELEPDDASAQRVRLAAQDITPLREVTTAL